MPKVMARVMTAGAAAIVALAWPGALAAHHSLARFDTTTPVWVKGTVVRFDRISPHARIHIEQKDGARTQRWSVDGPAPNALSRMGIDEDFLKMGDVVEVCGYLPKEATIWQLTNPEPNAVSMSGRLLNGEAIVMSDGREQSWGDYGVHRCFGPEYRDQHSR